MTPLDILFWLMIAMLGGVAWAIEAGLASRHRNLMLASTISAFGACLFIMFWIEDNSVLDLGPRGGVIKKKAGPGGERGRFEFEEEGGGGGRSGSSDGSGAAGTGAGSSTGGGDGKQAALNKSAKATQKSEDTYSRAPFRDCEHCPQLVIVPAGTLQLGSPGDEPGRAQGEPVARMVTIRQPFAIGRLEILRGEYAQFVKETGHRPTSNCQTGHKRGEFSWQFPAVEQDDRHPVVCVSREDVRVYLAWLGGKSGFTYRLPNEEEWEYAARAGKTTAFWQGDVLYSSQANVGPSRSGTIAGGLFKSNDFGLADVSGNAWEITADCLTNATADPKSAERCGRRVLKGGGWDSTPLQSRHAARATMADGMSINTTGFRIARDVDERDRKRLLTEDQVKAIKDAERKAAEIFAKEREKEEEEARKRRIEEAKAAAEAAAKAKERLDKKGR
jgi:formylglycine-generating enzyme required for sulfatase activity